MDAAPTYDFWWRFGAILSAEVAAMTVAAWALEKFGSSGVWRRMVWHVCLIGLMMLVAVETSGLGRIVGARFTVQAHPAEATFQYSETFSFTAEPSTAVEEPIVILTSPEPSAAIAPRQSWWPAILWLAGSAIAIFWAVFLRALFAIANRRRCRPATKEVVERAQQLAARLGLPRRVEAVEIGRISAPVAFGIMTPKIGVPKKFSEKFAPQQQEVMLAHELAHVAGRDAVWYLLADFVAALLWWHPMVWWARRRLHFTTEAAADEASMVVKDGPGVLAETLVTLGGGLLKQHRGALGIKGLRSGLACRVQKLVALKDGEWRGLSFRNGWLLRLGGPVLLAAGTIACFAWTGSSRGTPRDEWQNSLAGRTLAALSTALPSADLERIPGLLGDAKIFFDAGKLDHAEGLCEEVLKIDPENGEALQLIDAIAKARKAHPVENLVDKSGVRPREMERIVPSEAGASRDRFINPQTIGSFEQVTSNALNFSTEERKRQVRLTERGGGSNVVYTGRRRIYRLLETRLPSVMYDNVGLGQVLRRLRDEIRERDPEKEGIDFLLSAETPLRPVDSSTGRLPLGARDALLRLESRNIKIVPPLQNVSLVMVLDAICKVSDPALSYSVTDYAIVFLPAVKETPLYKRTYRIDAKALAAHFGVTLADEPEDEPSLERASGDLATYLRLTDRLLNSGVDLTHPKSLTLASFAGLVMVRAASEDHDVIQRVIKPFLSPARQVLVEVRVAELRGEAAGIKSALGIDITSGTVLNDPQYRLVIRALEQTARVDVMGAQRVTTLDGQQARFELTSLETLGLNDAIVHIVPQISGDGRNVHLTMMLGGNVTATARVRDRQTAMIPLPSVKKVYGEGVSVRVLTRIAFVTVTIVDAAGNRVYAEEHETNPFEGIWRF